MKNKSRIKGILAIVFALFMFSSVATKAQCSKISNNTRCSYKVIVTIFEKDPQTGFCTVQCGNQQVGVVPPFNGFPIFCGTCATCNIQVQIVAINGAPVAPITIDWFTGPQPIPAPCAGAMIKWDPLSPAFIIN
jgi:hypothetical protein